MTAIIGGKRIKIGGWTRHEIEKHEIMDEMGEDVWYDQRLHSIDARMMLNQIVDQTHIRKQLQKLKLIMRSREKLIDGFATISFITSYDIEYIINSSDLTDIYLLRSLYDDICEYTESIPTKLEVIDVYKSVAKNGKELLKMEQENKKYVDLIEKFYVEIINLIETIK